MRHARKPFAIHNALLTLGAIATLSACAQKDPIVDIPVESGSPEPQSEQFESRIAKLSKIKYVGAILIEGGLGKYHTKTRTPQWQILICAEQGHSSSGSVEFEIPENALGLNYLVADSSTHHVQISKPSKRLVLDYQYSAQKIRPYVPAGQPTSMYGISEFTMQTTDLSHLAEDDSHYAVPGWEPVLSVRYSANSHKVMSTGGTVDNKDAYVRISGHTFNFLNAVVQKWDSDYYKVCQKHQQEVLIVPQKDLIAPQGLF